MGQSQNVFVSTESGNYPVSHFPPNNNFEVNVICTDCIVLKPVMFYTLPVTEMQSLCYTLAYCILRDMLFHVRKGFEIKMAIIIPLSFGNNYNNREKGLRKQKHTAYYWIQDLLYHLD